MTYVLFPALSFSLSPPILLLSSLCSRRLDSSDFARLNEARGNSASGGTGAAAGAASASRGSAAAASPAFKKRFLYRELSKEQQQQQQVRQSQQQHQQQRTPGSVLFVSISLCCDSLFAQQTPLKKCVFVLRLLFLRFDSVPNEAEKGEKGKCHHSVCLDRE